MCGLRPHKNHLSTSVVMGNTECGQWSVVSGCIRLGTCYMTAAAITAAATAVATATTATAAATAAAAAAVSVAPILPLLFHPSSYHYVKTTTGSSTKGNLFRHTYMLHYLVDPYRRYLKGVISSVA